MPRHSSPIHISLVAIPDSMAMPVNGIFETLKVLNSLDPLGTGQPAFQVDIVGTEPGPLNTPTGLPITVHRRFSDVDRTDVVIVTSMVPDENNDWVTGRYPQAVAWMRTMNRQGSVLCSGCTGLFLLAETGLLNGLEATLHWGHAATFQRHFPEVNLNLRKILVSGGSQQEFVMAGATSSWQDLLLYLVGRYAGDEAARNLCNFMLFQWHLDSQAPYINFAPSTDHGDALVSELQEWLGDHASIACPVEALVRRSGLAESTVKRRFKQATGYSPLQYIQSLRIEQAKNRLERHDTPVDDISWEVGYEDPAFFRRLFKRITGMTPKEYRRKFQIPAYARTTG